MPFPLLPPSYAPFLLCDCCFVTVAYTLDQISKNRMKSQKEKSKKKSKKHSSSKKKSRLSKEHKHKRHKSKKTSSSSSSSSDSDSGYRGAGSALSQLERERAAVQAARYLLASQADIRKSFREVR